MYVVTRDPMINCQSDDPGLTARAATAAGSLVRTLRLWRARTRERRAFTNVDERELRDLGLSRYDVQRELAKPFWRG